MMAGAYTLAKNGHVRGDVLYSFFPPRLQAGLDLLLYIVFFIPGVVALCWAGYTYAAESFAIREHSTLTANGPPLYPFKMVIPFAGILLLLQGFVEIVRCVVCLRRGEWPAREPDVEEVDVDKLKAMVHVDERQST
jgi:TRAP-type mannitol/chloroaromatic compound transport system permease small subunit